jgi:hypothetical protein
MSAVKARRIGGAVALVAVVMYFYALKQLLNVNMLLDFFQLMASEIGLLLLFQGYRIE